MRLETADVGTRRDVGTTFSSKAAVSVGPPVMEGGHLGPMARMPVAVSIAACGLPGVDAQAGLHRPAGDAGDPARRRRGCGHLVALRDRLGRGLSDGELRGRAVRFRCRRSLGTVAGLEADGVQTPRVSASGLIAGRDTTPFRYAAWDGDARARAW